MRWSERAFPGDYRLPIRLQRVRSGTLDEILRGLARCVTEQKRPRYAKFEPVDPSVSLSLNEIDGSVSVEGGSAHCGVQVKSVSEVHVAIDRFQAAGIATLSEEALTCCYAVQDKVWATNPDGHKWEAFVVQQAVVKDDVYAKAGCCSPDLVLLKSCPTME